MQTMTPVESMVYDILFKSDPAGYLGILHDWYMDEGNEKMEDKVQDVISLYQEHLPFKDESGPGSAARFVWYRQSSNPCGIYEELPSDIYDSMAGLTGYSAQEVIHHEGIFFNSPVSAMYQLLLTLLKVRLFGLAEFSRMYDYLCFGIVRDPYLEGRT